MLACPNCSRRLDLHVTPKGMMYVCESCEGRAVAFSVLRKDAVARDFTNALWRKARYALDKKGRHCPHCKNKMAVVQLASPAGPMFLDVCTACQFAWFDPGEYQQVPRTAPAEEAPVVGLALSPAAELAMVDSRPGGAMPAPSQHPREEAADLAWPESFWQWLPGIFGLPIEFSQAKRSTLPVLTWLLAAACAATYALLAAQGALQQAALDYGYLPHQAFRHGGLTLLTSFVLHGGLWHLMANMYFLLLFGDNVEDHLGRLGYLLLLAASHLTGLMLHGAFDPRANLPLVGASGGISGVIAYYAIVFPGAKIGLWGGLWTGFRWLRMSAIAGLVLFLLAQLVGVWAQVHGFSSVSALGHVGGLGVGILVGCIARYVRAKVVTA